MVEQSQMLGAKTDNADLDLLRAVAGGDERALHELYARHGPYLLSYLIGKLGNRHLAEEVLQDVMMGVWRGAAGFRGDSRVRTWLLAIARRQAINAQRRHKVFCIPLDEANFASDPVLSKALDAHAEAADVRAALQRLSPSQRETLELVFYHGLTGPEAAQVLGIAQGTVKSRLHRAKLALKRLLRPREDTHAQEIW